MLIVTKMLELRSVEPSDAGFLADLFNNADPLDSGAPYDLVYPLSREMEEDWISRSGGRSDEAHMIVEMRKGHRPIGIVSVSKIDLRNASAALRIRLEEKSWDKGYGTEAVRETAKFMFERMNLRRVWLRVDEGNARAIRCYEKCGFALEGVLREDHIRDGAWRNSLVMSLIVGDLKEEER
jgi:RimJ/RimL family protein N-acetyltransferase